MQKKSIKLILAVGFIFFSSFLYGQEKKNGELTAEEARGLYSLLENVKGQKSLFPEEVNAKNLKSLLKPEYAEGATLYEKNPYALNILNCVFIEVKEKNKLIWFETFVSGDQSLTSDECIKIANEWNASRSFSIVTFERNEFHIQYFLTYKGGVHADNLNDTLEWIFSSSFYFENYLKNILKERNK